MKKLAIGVIATLALLAVSFAAPKVGTFKGEIMDSQCALLGSHDKMADAGQSAKDCTIKCVAVGGSYVLYDAATKTTYQLDDQKKPKLFAGATVKVTGDYDEAKKTIHVTKIEKGS